VKTAPRSSGLLLGFTESSRGEPNGRGRGTYVLSRVYTSHGTEETLS